MKYRAVTSGYNLRRKPSFVLVVYGSRLGCFARVMMVPALSSGIVFRRY